MNVELTELRKAISIIERLIKANNREGWEESETYNDVLEDATDFIDDYNLYMSNDEFFQSLAHKKGAEMIVPNMDYFNNEYKKASSWRARWNRLSLKHPEGGRLAVKQEYIERRAKIANQRVADIMKLYDEITKD